MSFSLFLFLYFSTYLYLSIDLSLRFLTCNYFFPSFLTFYLSTYVSFGLSVSPSYLSPCILLFICLSVFLCFSLSPFLSFSFQYTPSPFFEPELLLREAEHRTCPQKRHPLERPLLVQEQEPPQTANRWTRCNLWLLKYVYSVSRLMWSMIM